MAEEFAPVVGGRGEDAVSDFQANKFLTLPDARGRVLAGKDDMGGTPADRLKNQLAGAFLGASGGAEGILLEAGNIPHPLQVDLSVNTDGSSVGGSASLQGSSAGPSGGVSNAGSTSGGSIAPHNNVQPTLVTHWIIKL
jgi:microcystin-dependent protein